MAGALPLLYGMAEEIVTGVDPAACQRQPARARAASVRYPPVRACLDAVGFTAASSNGPARIGLTAARGRTGDRVLARTASARAAHGAASRPAAGAAGRGGPTGPVVGAVYSPIHSSFHALVVLLGVAAAAGRSRSARG